MKEKRTEQPSPKFKVGDVIYFVKFDLRSLAILNTRIKDVRLMTCLTGPEYWYRDERGWTFTNERHLFKSERAAKRYAEKEILDRTQHWLACLGKQLPENVNELVEDLGDAKSV